MQGKKPLPAKEADLLRGSTVIKILEIDGCNLFCESALIIFMTKSDN